MALEIDGSLIVAGVRDVDYFQRGPAKAMVSLTLGDGSHIEIDGLPVEVAIAWAKAWEEHPAKTDRNPVARAHFAGGV
jgi:hypothetical protein